MSKKLLTIAIFSAIFIGGAGLFYTQAQNQTKTEILKINDEIQQKKDAIKDLNQQIEESKNILAGLLREIYKNDHKNAYLVLLLENSFADFLAEAQFLENLEKGISDQ